MAATTAATKRLGRETIKTDNLTVFQPYPQTRLFRSLEMLFRLADFIMLPHVLMWGNIFFKRNTRPLTLREIHLARSVFGNSIDYHKVRIDEKSWIGCRRYHIAYVGFHFINAWGALDERLFIHEMVHVWQYQQFGSVYIPRALWAQNTKEGYNYGGIAALEKALLLGLDFRSFNYEQQGDIVSDYFCLKNGMTPRWCFRDMRYLPVFEKVMAVFQSV